MKTSKLNFKHYLMLSSLIFGMFFGAGNLIFPVHLGQLAGVHWFSAALGFLFSGILLPLGALLALAITRAEGIFDLARPLGKGLALTFLILVHATLGPFFATPRTATVPFSMFANHFAPSMQGLALLIYSGIFFGIVYFMSLKEGKITERIGKLLNPIFLILLFVIFLFAFIKPMGSADTTKASEAYLTASFTNGFLEGYNTMDALAALAFGITVVTAIKSWGIKSAKETSISMAKAGVVGMAGIAIIYLISIFLGATSLHHFALSENGGTAFAQIANFYMGPIGEALLATLSTITCMSTAMGLVIAFAQDFHKRFPQISYKIFLTVNCGISFVFANLGLNQIIAWSTPVLMFLYPIAIALIFLGITSPLFQNDATTYRLTVFFAFIPAIFDMLNASPAVISQTTLAKTLTAFAGQYFPFFNLGFGWFTFGICGYFLGLVAHFIKAKTGNQNFEMEE
ncbi:branched-chain amino acid transport system II carrier protein [Ligilactobacillus equi]